MAAEKPTYNDNIGLPDIHYNPLQNYRNVTYTTRLTMMPVIEATQTRLQRSYDYKKGRFSLRTFTVTGKKEQLIIQQHKRGDFNADYNKFHIVFHNLPFSITSIQIDNVEIPIDNVKVGKKQSILIDKEFNELHLLGK